MMHLGGVSEIAKPGQYDGLERKAIGNDEVKDRTAGDATDNLFNNNGLDSSGKTYKNTKEKIKEDGNELIAKKTNNDVKDEKYAKDNSYNRTVNNNKQSIHEGEYNINNINNNTMNEYNQANTADTATAAFGEGNNTNELAENKLTPPKKQKKKGILNKLFWGKQKSSDSSESSSNAQSNECDNNGGANEVVNEENNYECICGVCNACTNNRKEEEKERKKKKNKKKKHSEECDDNIILRTTVNTMTTTMTTTVDFHNKQSEQELIQQPRHEESSEYQEECSEHYAQRRELIQESEQNPSIEEVDATVNKSATPSTKCAHVKMTKKERTNRAKAEFALHDPLNEVGDDDPVMTSKERKAEEKLKRKEEHSHQTSCELDEFQDHMTGSVYNGSDICPHCNYPRSSSVWCPVSLRHHGSDALCTLHQSSGAASHDSTKRSPRTLLGKGKDVKKNIASSNDTNNSNVDDLHSTPIPSSESSSSPAFSSDHKVTHSITSWFNRRGPHHRHKHHGSNDDDNNTNNNCNYNDNTQESEQCCLNSADTSNLDDASTEQVSSPEQQALLERGEANFETAHPNRLVTTKIQSNCDNTFTSNDANHTENNKCEEIIVQHDHSLLSAPLETQKVAPEQNTMNGEPNTHNDDVNKNTFSSDVQGEEMLNTGETQWNEHEMQYYYFVNENGETMYYATRVTGNENDNVHNEHEINKEKLEIQNSKLPDETINEHDISKHYKDYTYDNDQKETKENTKVNTNGKNLDEKANENDLYNKDNKVEEHVTQYSKQTNDNVNDGTLTWNASHSSLTTTDNISEKCESNSKKKQGFAKKISHFFSRSNKTSPESENLIVCCHHADPVTMEVTATTSKEINESCCHEESNNGNGGAIERETECSNKNVIKVSTPETSGVDHTSNSYEDIKSGAANNNSTEDNNECKSPQPTTSQVVVTEVAYDTKVTEKKVPRLTEKELRQRFKELYKDEKKQREVLEMEYKKEHNALKRCCRADVIEIDRVRHAKKHNIKERKENSGKGKNNPEDDDNDKEEHKSTNENYEWKKKEHPVEFTPF